VEAFEDRVVPSADVLTYHNDLGRTGANLSETVLTPANVNSTDFGKLFSYTVDGQVYAEPLYQTDVFIPGQGTFNVVFIVTEHDSVYAFDADSNTSGPNHDGLLWHVSFLGAGITPFSQADAFNCGQITPEIGITATPVIDPASATIYVVAQTKQVVGTTTTYHQQLHALDITSGEEKFGGPVEVTATYPGMSAGDTFDPRRYKERPGLVLLNGVVYTSWSSHCDATPSHGWVIGYDAQTLAQVAVFNTSPNSQLATIWQAGGAPAVDSDGNIYFETGNCNSGGTDPNLGDYGEAFMELSSADGLSVADYFIPANYQALDAADQDIGSGAPIVLPDQPGDHPHLLVGAGKDGRIFLMDRDAMGGLNNPPNGPDLVVQELPTGTIAGGSWDVPAYFDAGSDGNRWIYYAGNGDRLKAFRLTNGLLSPSPTSQSPTAFTGNYGATPIISANGTSDAIVWAVQEGTTAVLRAYDALNLAHELYNSNQAAGDHLGTGVKFATPTVADGKVFVATTGASNTVSVFGLFNQANDPGFERPFVGTGPGAYQYHPTDSPWTFGSGSGVAGNGSDFTSGNPDAPQGTQVAFLQGYGGSISQAVNLAAGTYSIRFSAAQRVNSQASQQSVQVVVDGVDVGDFAPAGPDYAAYSTNNFLVSAGPHTISFVGTDPDGQDNTAFLDQVLIVQQPVVPVADPGFETPAVGTGPGAYTYSPGGSPWTFANGSGVAGNGSDFTSGNPDAPQGTQVAFVQAFGAITQAVNFPAAGTYTLSFSAAQRVNSQVSYQTLQVQVDGVDVGDFSPAGPGYTTYTATLTVPSAGAHAVTFAGTDPDGQDNTVFLDQVTISPTPTPAPHGRPGARAGTGQDGPLLPAAAAPGANGVLPAAVEAGPALAALFDRLSLASLIATTSPVLPQAPVSSVGAGGWQLLPWDELALGIMPGA
jgi:hypothetical protein